MNTFYVVDTNKYNSFFDSANSMYPIKDDYILFYIGDVDHLLIITYEDSKNSLEVLASRIAIQTSVSNKVKTYLKNNIKNGQCKVIFDRVRNEIIIDITNDTVFTEFFSSVPKKKDGDYLAIRRGKKSKPMFLRNDSDNLGLIFATRNIVESLNKSEDKKNISDMLSLVADFFDLNKKVPTYLFSRADFDSLFDPKSSISINDFKLDALKTFIKAHEEVFTLLSEVIKFRIPYNTTKVAVKNDLNIVFLPYTVNEMYIKWGILYIDFKEAMCANNYHEEKIRIAKLLEIPEPYTNLTISFGHLLLRSGEDNVYT